MLESVAYFVHKVDNGQDVGGAEQIPPNARSNKNKLLGRMKRFHWTEDSESSI